MSRSGTSFHAPHALLPAMSSAAALRTIQPECASWPWHWVSTRGKLLQRVAVRRKAETRLRAASEPLLLCATQPRALYRRVLVPVDFSPSSLAAARLAARMFAPLAFLATFSRSDALSGMSGFARTVSTASLIESRDALLARMTALIRQLDIAHDLVSVVVRHGNLDVVTASYARQMQSDLVVLGQRHASRAEALLLGGTEWRLHRALDVDVLVVPA